LTILRSSARRAVVTKSEDTPKIFGLVLQYGYAEEGLAGYDIWLAAGGHFDSLWGALRGLSQFLYDFYKRGADDRRPYDTKACCETFKGQKIGNLVADDGVYPFDLDASIRHCLVCGGRLVVEDSYDPEAFTAWVYDQYTLPAHQQPPFEEGWEHWSRESYEYLFHHDFPHTSDAWPFVYRADLVLPLALPEDQIPEGSRDVHRVHFKFHFDRPEARLRAERSGT